MTYSLKIHEADVPPAEIRQAEKRFRDALEATLGDEALVLPVHAAYQRIVRVYGEEPELDLLTDAERLVLDQWRLAEQAAVAAAFGPNRYIGDAMYEIGPG
jgi:hypothetical protein